MPRRLPSLACRARPPPSARRCPRQRVPALWHLDTTNLWPAAHGRVYLHVIVDCCTHEVAGWAWVAVFEGIEGFYNPTRRNSCLGMPSAHEFETRHAAAIPAAHLANRACPGDRVRLH